MGSSEIDDFERSGLLHLEDVNETIQAIEGCRETHLQQWIEVTYEVCD